VGQKQAREEAGLQEEEKKNRSGGEEPSILVENQNCFPSR